MSTVAAPARVERWTPVSASFTAGLAALLANPRLRELDALRDSRPDLTSLTDEELYRRGREVFEARFRQLFGQHLFTSYCATVPVGIIQQVCEAVGRPGDMFKLLAGFGGVDSAAPSYAMWDLSRLPARSDDYKEGDNKFTGKIQKVVIEVGPLKLGAADQKKLKDTAEITARAVE